MRCMKIVALLLSAFLLNSIVGVSASSKAATYDLNQGIAPAYECASYANSTLTISSGVATCTSKCSGVSNVVRISVEQTLEKHSGFFWVWNAVDGASWSTTKIGKYASVVNTKSGLSNGTYRVRTVFTLTSSSGDTETITIYSTEKNVG